MKNALLGIGVSAAVSAFIGCGGGEGKLVILEERDAGFQNGSDSGTTGDSPSDVKTGDTGSGTTVLPCAVTQALASCVSAGCHSTTDATPLVSYANLTKMSSLASTLTEAAESVALMQGGSPVM